MHFLTNGFLNLKILVMLYRFYNNFNNNVCCLFSWSTGMTSRFPREKASSILAENINYKYQMLVNTLTDKKTIIAAFIFLKALKISLGKKEILLSNTNLSIINNIFYLSLKIFFRKKKVAEYFSNLNKKKLQQWKSKLDFLFKNLTFLKQNVNHYLIINLNKKIKFFIVKDLLKSFKKFKQNLFARRNDLFSDFLNTSCLLILKKLTANTYILILGQIFTLLLKKKHGSFFFFKNII